MHGVGSLGVAKGSERNPGNAVNPLFNHADVDMGMRAWQREATEAAEFTGGQGILTHLSLRYTPRGTE